MSREEIVNHIAYQQEIAAFEYANLHFDNINKISERNAAYNGFEAGAEWMQEKMIEKACKWLLNIDFDGQEFRDCDESFNNDLFVDAFRKAMEK